jgi:hypothetical protein
MLWRLRSRACDGQGWQADLVVRRDWPDGGHDFFGFGTTWALAERLIGRDRWFWRLGPIRPASYALVLMSRRDFDLHHRSRRLCRAPDCPTSALGWPAGAGRVAVPA